MQKNRSSKQMTEAEYMQYREHLLSLEAASSMLSAWQVASALREHNIVRGIDYRGSSKGAIWESLRKREYNVVVDIARFAQALSVKIDAIATRHARRCHDAQDALIEIHRNA